MKVATIDGIVSDALQAWQLPIHYYLQFLGYGLEAVNELGYDRLPVIKTVRLYTDSRNRIQLPSSYVDWVKVGVEIGQYVQVYAENPALTRLHNFTDDGNKIPYPKVPSVKGQPVLFANTVNDYGEAMGNILGWGNGEYRNQFKEMRETGEIFMGQEFGENKPVYLEFISESTVEIASMIHPYAVKVIKAYINWQYKLHSTRFNRLEAEAERKDYTREYKKLSGRLSSLTLTSIVRIINSTFKQTIKT